MNENKNIKEVYDQIHAPEALLGKVMEMKKDTFKFRKVVKYAIVAVLALVLTVAAGNGICYAATGQTLFSKIKFFVNGEEVEHEITWREEDGKMVGTFEMELESVDENTGEPNSVHGLIEVQPDEVAVEAVDGLEDAVILTIVTTGEGGSVSVEKTEDELNLSIDTNKTE